MLSVMAQGKTMFNKVILIGFVFLLSFDSNACSCRNVSPQENFDNASNILIGRVVNLEMVFDENEKFYQKVTLDEIEYIKGKKSPIIFASMDMNSCQGEIFQLGQTNILFTSEDNWSLGWCGGTQQIDERIDYQVEFVNAIRTLSVNVP
jgi:hypothetical protein